MTDFILKSTLSQGLLYIMYFFFLEKEKMHRFNRFFLLFSLVFSFIIPFVTFEIISESVAVTPQGAIPQLPFSYQIIQEEDNHYLPVFLWSLYVTVTIILFIRFISNLIKIRQKINASVTEEIQNATLVLLDEKILPHTFLNYVFINEDDYKNRKIEDELYTHELTHVRQRHTLDILFIEILKTIFWFNPLFFLYKKAIQLNHEFLADEKVVKSYNNISFYQDLLLEKATSSNNFYLASNLNFLITKKRLIMMTKSTSKSKAFILQLSVMPLIAIVLFSCATKTVAKTESVVKATDMTKIEILNVSNREMDSLKKSNPKLYTNQKAADYRKTQITYVDKNGHAAINTTYNKTPETLPVIILPKIEVATEEIVKMEMEYILATDPQAIALKNAHPEEFSKDPATTYKQARMKMILKDSSVVEQIMFQKVPKDL